MRVTLLTATICLIISTTKVVAQCSVRNEALGSGASCLFTKWEQLPVESHDGIFANFYFVRLLLTYRDNTTIPSGYTLQLKYAKNISADLFPRRLYFQFYNFPGFPLDATNEETIDTQSKFYYYFLSDEEVKILKEHALSSVEIVDYRTNDRISCKPYTFLFTETMDCLKQRLEKGY